MREIDKAGGGREGERERERVGKRKAKIDRFKIAITNRPVSYLLRREKRNDHALHSETMVGKQEWEQA